MMILYALLKWSNQLHLCVLALNAHTKQKLLPLSLDIREFELFLLPPECHLRESHDLPKHLDLNHVIMPVLKPHRLAVVILIRVRVTPPIRVHQKRSMSYRLVIIELVVILLHHWPHHHPQQHPRPHIEPVQLHEDPTLSLPHVHEIRPIHLLVTGLHHPVWNTVQVLTGIHPEDVLCLYLTCLDNCLLCLLVVLFGNQLQLFCSLLQLCLLGLELIRGTVQLVGQLFVLLSDTVIAAWDFFQSCF